MVYSLYLQANQLYHRILLCYHDYLLHMQLLHQQTFLYPNKCHIYNTQQLKLPFYLYRLLYIFFYSILKRLHLFQYCLQVSKFFQDQQQRLQVEQRVSQHHLMVVNQIDYLHHQHSYYHKHFQHQKQRQLHYQLNQKYRLFCNRKLIS